ncbi:MAG: 3-hydroxyacyl-ACP dehydratase FabZ family protein [Bauldia sp.]
MRLEYFQMIDRIERIERDPPAIVALATVPSASTVFEGHFPGYPVMPGALLMETMAQASGWLILALNGMSRMPFFAGVKRGKFRSFVAPETRLTASARLIHEGSGFSVTDAQLSVDGKGVADCELTFRVVDFPAEALRREMHATAVRIGLPGTVAV